MVDYLSLCTTPIILLKDDVEVSQGTGFFYLRKVQDEQVLFLVTNYHVLTGYSPTENKPPKGDSIAFYFHQSESDPSKIKHIRISLFTKKGNSIWFTSSACPEADLAVIPIFLSFYSDCNVSCISDEWLKSGNLKVRTTTQITLIGYPYGYYDQVNALPIWKTGNVASEPEVDFHGKPLLTVDISAFPGMSGAPAFAVAYGMYESEDGSSHAGGARKFIGIYASMQMLNQKIFLEELTHSKTDQGIFHSESLQLGHVWKARLIDELINEIDIKKWESEIAANL